MRAFDFHAHVGPYLDPMGDDGKLGPIAAMAAEAFTVEIFAATGYRAIVPIGSIGAVDRLTWTAIRQRLSRAWPEELVKAWTCAGVAGGLVCPVEPFMTTLSALEGAAKFPQIKVSLGIDPSSGGIEEAIAGAVESGMKVAKLHPMMARSRADSQCVVSAVKAAQAAGLTVQVHTGGTAEMFGGTESDGGTDAYAALASACDSGRLHFVHGGLHRPMKLLDSVSKMDHVSLGVSFQSSTVIRRMVDRVGPGRVLYESDWPIGDPQVTKKQVELALEDDEAALSKVMYGNAIEILGVTVS